MAKEYKLSPERLKELQDEMNYLKTVREKEVAELKAYLESQGKTVVATGMADYCCMNMGVKTAMKKLTAAGPDAVVCMSWRRGSGSGKSQSGSGLSVQ